MKDMIVKTVVCDLWGKCKNLLEGFLGWVLRLDLKLVLLRQQIWTVGVMDYETVRGKVPL